MANTNMFYGASPLLFERAKKLRRCMTEAEANLGRFVNAARLLAPKGETSARIGHFDGSAYCDTEAVGWLPLGI